MAKTQGQNRRKPSAKNQQQRTAQNRTRKRRRHTDLHPNDNKGAEAFAEAKKEARG